MRYSLTRPGRDDEAHQRQRGLLAGKQLAKTEEINFTSSGNAKVQGWIVKPPDFDASKKYPLILEIHGGPFGNYNVGFNYMFQNFAANDFVVLYVNPRGSTGYGTAFSDGDRPQLSRARLRRSDGGRGCGGRQGLRRHVADVRLRLQRRRRALELGDRPHRPIRGGRGALPGDRLAEHGGPHRHPAVHLQLLQEAVLGRSERLAVALVADVRSAT